MWSALSFLGGESLVKGAVSLARNFNLSNLLVSAVVVGFGTSMPEMAVSVEAAFKGATEIAIGNVVGSNIANILLIIGISGLVLPLLVKKEAVKRDVVVMIAASVFLCGLSFIGSINFISGMIMFTTLIVYIAWAYNEDNKINKEIVQHIKQDIEGLPPLSLSKAVFLCLIGFVLLISGASILVDGAVSIAKDFGISETIIGLTIVAVGTSLPELATSIVAAYRKHTDVIIGNIVGSNIFNILAILGITSMVFPIPLVNQIANFDVWIMFGVTVFLSGYLLRGLIIGRLTGLLMIGFYVIYLVFLYMRK